MNGQNIIEGLLARSESTRLAFVSSPEEKSFVGRSVCAMLNSKGGTVLVGVGDQRQINASVTRESANALNLFLHERITPQILFTVTLDEVQQGRVISVDVPEGPDRPYVFDGTVFVRDGAVTTAADSATIREMVVRQAREMERWERRVADSLTLSDLELGLLDETVRRAQDRRGYRFEDDRNPESVLADLALMRFGQLTNAADVLFGRRVFLRHPQTRLRAVRYETDRGDRFIDEQLFEGPALSLLDEAMAFVKRHVNIAAEFRPGQLTRESRPQYPFNSLREGLVNALVHRDYAAFSGGVSVSIYPARIEIWNSGYLPAGLTPGKLRAATHDSILINPDISHVFYLHELMERVGRGTFKIVQECKALGMRLPEWRNVASGVRLMLYASTGQEDMPLELNDRQKILLDRLAVGQSITIHEFLGFIGGEVSDRQARRDLHDLVNAGLLEPVGAGPTTRYKRT